MLNVLITIWTLIGIITGGAILFAMAIGAIGFVVAMIAGIIEGVKKSD